MKAVKHTDAGITVVDVDEPATLVKAATACSCTCSRRASAGATCTCSPTARSRGCSATSSPACSTTARAVAVDPGNQCGVCALCAGGLRHLCGENAILGVGRDGGLAERVLREAPTRWCGCRPGLPVEHACLVEPMAVAIHGMAVGEIVGGERVAVVGAGKHRVDRGRGRRGEPVRRLARGPPRRAARRGRAARRARTRRRRVRRRVRGRRHAERDRPRARARAAGRHGGVPVDVLGTRSRFRRCPR